MHAEHQPRPQTQCMLVTGRYAPSDGEHTPTCPEPAAGGRAPRKAGTGSHDPNKPRDTHIKVS